MIPTYSVIIQNQKTLESFSQYQPLFAEAVNSNRISVCKWNESGTTIDTALPELRNLTDDKDDWRAIIVRYIDDNYMKSFESDPRNPFDFCINKIPSDITKESPIPLVRLTQMLGGVPPLEVQFAPEIVREEHKAPKTIYVPVEDSERKRTYKRLVDKYQFDGKKPSAILIVTVRNRIYQEENISTAWKSHKESESSEFWKRNHFPSICRFLAYDVENQGPVQKEADDFGFWYSVMLMAMNEWDSGTLQAYRLYSLGIDIDKEGMTDSFQILANRLRDAKRSINMDIQRDLSYEESEEEKLPDYRLQIPVHLKLPEKEAYLVKETSFPLLSNGPTSDVAIWDVQKRNAEDELDSTIRAVERVLDQTADKMRPSCKYDKSEVYILNQYQEEDLTRETDNLYQSIVDLQGKLPQKKISASENVQKISDKIENYLIGRVMGRPALIAFLVIALLMILAATPALIDFFSHHNGSLYPILYIVLGSVGLIAILSICAIFIQKIRLNKLINQYNQYIRSAFSYLIRNASDYSKYMGMIASHSRGMSYLNISARKKHFSDTEHFSKYKHIKAIDALLGKLKVWSKAYHLDIDFTSKRTEQRIEVDTSLSPRETKLYSFETGKSYPVAVNNSGMTMTSPYPFATKIEVIREELYDDE